MRPDTGLKSSLSQATNVFARTAANVESAASALHFASPWAFEPKLPSTDALVTKTTRLQGDGGETGRAKVDDRRCIRVDVTGRIEERVPSRVASRSVLDDEAVPAPVACRIAFAAVVRAVGPHGEIAYAGQEGARREQGGGGDDGELRRLIQRSF